MARVGECLNLRERLEALDAIAEEIEMCRRCPLCKERNKIVPGIGFPDADVVLLGEAPGRDEDKQGFPFVGRAGQKLNELIGSIGLLREDVFITNTVKCRPPNNRDPEPQEMRTCRRFLDRQLDIICPKVIVTLGRCASQIMLQTASPMKSLRGELFEQEDGVWILPTYHPAYLLRNPSAKQMVEEDLSKVKDIIL